MYLLANLEAIKHSDVFVGSFSSEISRLVEILRATQGKHPSTGLSVDLDWFPWGCKPNERGECLY